VGGTVVSTAELVPVAPPPDSQVIQEAALYPWLLKRPGKPLWSWK
jgi:hypothetical protein